MPKTDRGNGGQHFYLSCTCNRILSSSPQREDMGRKFTGNSQFFRIRTSRLYKFAWSPQEKTCYFGPSFDKGIKIVGQIE